MTCTYARQEKPLAEAFQTRHGFAPRFATVVIFLAPQEAFGVVFWVEVSIMGKTDDSQQQQHV